MSAGVENLPAGLRMEALAGSVTSVHLDQSKSTTVGRLQMH